MERTSEIIPRITPDQLVAAETSQQKLTRSLGISQQEAEIRRAILAKILTDDRLAHQYEADAPEDIDILAQAIMPVTRSIPVAYLYESYVRAMESRQPNDTYQIKGVEMVAAYSNSILPQLEMESVTHREHNQRLLPEYATGACGRCYKRKDEKGRVIECLEISLVDGSLLGPCDHRPLTDEEKAEAARQKADFLTTMRAEARRKHEAKLKAGVDQPKEEKPVGTEMECSSCHRIVNTLAGWTEGEQCGIKLDRESTMCPQCESPAGVLNFGKMVCRECFHVYEVVVCEGKMLAPCTGKVEEG